MSPRTLSLLTGLLLGGSILLDASPSPAARGGGLAAPGPVASIARKKGSGSAPSFDPRAYDPDCISECSKKQKACMLTCAAIGDESEHKECVADCVTANVACSKACPKRK